MKPASVQHLNRYRQRKRQMKNHRYILQTMLIAAAVFTASDVQAQRRNETDVKKLVESGNFTFKAQTALPSAGNSVFLNSDYDIRVSKDTLWSFLPYFGRAFTAPMNPRQSALDFVSTEFSYKVESRRKGWNVDIEPQNHDVRSMTLSISPGGSATLQVISNSRQAISFSGYISERH
jgi:hypothetical protein